MSEQDTAAKAQIGQAARLAEPFDPRVLSEKPKGGRKFTYVPAAEVVARMNHVLGPGRWGVSVGEAFRDGDDWIIGRATVWAEIDGQRGERSAYGGQEINRYSKGDNAGLPVDLGDDYKGALTDAIKKACQAFGVALDLARSEDAIAADLPPWWEPLGWATEAEADADLDQYKAVFDALTPDEKKGVGRFIKEKGWTAWPHSREQLAAIREHLDAMEAPFVEAAQ